MLAKAAGCGADAVIFDLEDAVAADRKSLARQLVHAALRVRASAPPVWVRVNATDIAADVRAVAHPALAGIVLAKAELDSLATLDGVLAAVEASLGGSRSIPVVPLIETARGLVDVTAIACAPRVRNLALGEADLAAELGIDRADAVAVAAVRMPLVVASASAGLVAPTGPTSTDYRDLATLRASTLALVGQGFRARSAIHPVQVAVINEVLTPSAADVAQARQQIAAFERAGGGAAAGGEGIMVDAATIRAARDVVARWQAAGMDDSGGGAGAD